MTGKVTAIDPGTGQPADGAPLGVLLTAHAQVTPDAPALTFDGRTFSFAQLDALANQRARQLTAMGVAGGDRVIISMPNCPEYFEAAFALWKIGATPCPVSHRLAHSEFDQIVALTKPRLLVGTMTCGGVPSLNPATVPAADFDPAPLAPAISRPGKIANSGGSTGRPKLIVDPLPSVWGPDKEAVRRNPRMRVLNPGPLYHSAPFNMMMLAVAQGCHVVCMERFDAAAWLRLVERHRIQWAYLVPTMMSRISRLDPDRTDHADLSSLQTVLHMAAPCPVDVKRWWIDRIAPDAIWEVYGGTERVGVTMIGGADWLAHPGSVGRASKGQEILILDEAHLPLPSGEIGEIFFRKPGGPGRSYEYIGAESRARGEEDSFGDMGWLDADGWLFIADRRTDMVVIGGVNVYPAEIEAAFEAMPLVLGCAVIGLPDPDMGNYLHAIVQLHPDVGTPDPESLIAQAGSQVGPLKRPRTIEFTTDPIRDDAGKVRRAALRAARLDGALPGPRGP